MSIKGTLRRVGKKIGRLHATNMFNSGVKDTKSGRRIVKSHIKAVVKDTPAGKKAAKKMRDLEMHNKRNKQGLALGGAALGLAGAETARRGHKQYKEGKTVKGRIRKAIGR